MISSMIVVTASNVLVLDGRLVRHGFGPVGPVECGATISVRTRDDQDEKVL
jgi:hypothetical protein